MVALAATGRFLQVDPIEGGSANNYDYASADPVNNYDLNGMWCWKGIGTTCTRYVRDKDGRTVPVQYRIRKKGEVKHGLSWSTQKWLISHLDQTGGGGTRVEYGGRVYEYLCSSGSCEKSGRSVYVRSAVDFRTTSGRTFGLITVHCLGPDFCPAWINNGKL